MAPSQFTPAHAAALSPVAAAALGAVLGAAVGDAAGAHLEFAGVPDAAGVAAALTMPGGGVWRLSPGQVRCLGTFRSAHTAHLSLLV